ncbi:cysteine desulfurase [Gordonia otitidis]|uniref:cysteine desulfurase family protein n=1 Tax=Gordonia otitidis TaxID=249058 RepID=UPI001D14D03E|nr:cysteine desulfurase family protein [Gordonia otitidis]UEA60909.1 cysteine desulfurase [Gordonia otitidis]
MIYLDYNGSTPVDPRVAKTVESASSTYANPSSLQHGAGQDAAETIEEARERVAAFVGRPARDVIFTSGASEAAAIGIVGLMLGLADRPNVVVSATEHKAILAAAELGTRFTQGEVRSLRVLLSGEIDLDHLTTLIDDSVGLVIVMAANNETGVLNPVSAAQELVAPSGALFFSDITQLAGKAEVRGISRLADAMVMSSHKIYGPKGAGALVADRRVQSRIVPLLAGGGQERGLRGGTQNTAAIAGFGHAAEIADVELLADSVRLSAMTRQLWKNLNDALDSVELNGHEAPRVPNTLNLRFANADADAVMASMPDIAVSSGSACQSATPTQSHVLQAMGLTSQAASESLRISLGRPTTKSELDYATRAIVAAVSRVRELAA